MEHSKWIRRMQGLIRNAEEDSLEKPSWDEYFMSIAFLISARSPDKRLKVGCVLVSYESNRIISTGYNGFPAGFPHKSIIKDDHEQATVHAEQNAITDAARRGVSLEGATAYITHYPCSRCALLLMSVGVKKIFYFSDYKNDPIVEEIISVPVVEIKQL